MNRKSRYFVVAALMAMVVPSLIVAASGKNDLAAGARSITVIDAVFKEMSARYVDSVDADRAMRTAVDAMLNDLDPYTEFITASEAEDFMAMTTTGEYGGIGSVIMQRKEGGVFVSEPYEGSPAAESGLRPGDRIVRIDTFDTRSWDTKKVSDHLKGQANTPVHVVVERPYVADSVLTFDIMRRKIQMPTVPYYASLADGIGYIQLTKFNETSPDEVRDALLALKGEGIKSLILDLRGNGGGLVESAIKIANFFVPKNTEIIRTKGREKTEEKIYKTTQKPVDTELPLCILVDGGSASASEIVTGSLQDLDRAVVVGSRSFGKGLVQSTIQLPYDNMLKVTTAKYYIPSGRLIQAIDYSHRDADGNIQRVPDSLTNVFHTAGGREVRDGGGITPDINVEWDKVSRLTYNIYADNWAFDFANKYRAEHPSICKAEDFAIDDSTFAEFKRFIDPKRFSYDKVCETGIATLREAAQIEGYMNDSTKQAFDVLEGLLKHNLSQDLDNNRAAINDILAEEIVSRYYYERGRIIQSLKHDKGLDAAVKVLSDQAEYRRILAPVKQDKKKKK